nr:hypothetical protein [Tepidiforma sp.]
MEEAVRLGGFDDGFAAFAEPEVAAEDAPAEGVVDDGGAGIGADGAAEGIEQARAAVGEGEEVDGPGGAGLADPGGDGSRGFVGGEAALELLGCNEDAHVSSSRGARRR